MPLEDLFGFNPLGGLPATDNSTGMDPIRPCKGGLQWCAVPSEKTGIVYRCTSSGELHTLRLDHTLSTDDPLLVLYKITLPALPLHCSASADGRLVAVACGDGSIRCYNALTDQFTERWILTEAHSYRISSWEDSVSFSRSYGAGAAGPLRSLEFSGTLLLWADDSSYNENGVHGKGLQVVEAAVAETPTIVMSQLDASCAAWQPSTSCIAVGTTNGRIFLVDYQNYKLLNQRQINFEEAPEVSSCNHVVWLTSDTVGASFVTVTPEEEDDEDDPDDPSLHEIIFFILQVNVTDGSMKTFSELGEVLGFFNIPKGGRHVFVTSLLPTLGSPLILIATNVASEIGIVAYEDGEWKILDLTENCKAECPTVDDEFTYPVGLACAPGPVVILPNTDGSLSVFKPFLQGKTDFFPQVTDVPTPLPAEPLGAVSQSVAPATLPPPASAPASSFTFGATPATAPLGPVFGGPSSGDFNFAVASMSSPVFGGPTFGSARSTDDEEEGSKSSDKSSEEVEWVDGNPAAGFIFKKEAPVPGPVPSFGPPSTFGLSKPSFGATSGFGSPATPLSIGSSTPAFGQTSALGGTKLETSPGFGSGSAAPTFGSTSPLGGAMSSEKQQRELAESTTPSDNKAASSFGSGSSSPVFGSSFAGSTSFGAVAKSPAAKFGSPSPSGATPADSTPLVGLTKPRFDTLQQVTDTVATAGNKKDKDQASPQQTLPKRNDEGRRTGPDADRAREAFDTVDVTGIGFLPISRMEDLLEELGEGFYGDELDEQIKSIDSRETGKLWRADFIDWYVALAENAKRNDDSSLDTDEREEREEEKVKANDEFTKLSEDGGLTIDAEKFPALMEALGTTYCADGNHAKAKEQLTEDGKIALAPFLHWYIVDFMFAGDEDSDYEEEGNTNIAPDSSTGGAVSSWGETFGVPPPGSWKCDVCSVQNRDPEAVQCASCTSPRSGFNKEAEGKETLIPEKPSTATTGFTFSASPATSSTFSFGFPTGGEANSSTVLADPKVGLGSIPFGFGSSQPAEEKAPAQGIGLNTSQEARESKAATSDENSNDPRASVFGSGKGAPIFGFTPQTPGFGEVSKSNPSSSIESKSSPFDLFGKKTLGTPASLMAKPLFAASVDTSQISKEDESSATNQMATNRDSATSPQEKTDGKVLIVESGESEVMVESAKKAREVFDMVDSSKSGFLPVSRAEDLLEKLGENFHGDELNIQISLMDPNKTGQLERKAFLAWYTHFVQSNDDGSSFGTEEREEREEEKAKATEGFAKLSNDGGNTIDSSDFPALMEALGTTYCEDGNHAKAKTMLTKEGKIELAAFLDWYIDFLFAGDEDTESEDDEGRDVFKSTSIAPNASSAATSSWGDGFGAPPPGSWKCGVCMVQNDNSEAVECASCTSVRPGLEKSDTKSSTHSAAPSSFFANSPHSSNFSFGLPSSGHIEMPSTGFTFGFGGDNVTEGSELAKPAEAKPSSNFSFGFGEISGTGQSAKKSSFGLASGLSQGTSKITFGFAPASRKDDESKTGGVGEKQGDSAAKSSAPAAAIPPMPKSAPKPIAATMSSSKPNAAGTARGSQHGFGSETTSATGTTESSFVFGMGPSTGTSSSASAFGLGSASLGKSLTFGFNANQTQGSGFTWGSLAETAEFGKAAVKENPKPLSAASFQPASTSASKPVPASMISTSKPTAPPTVFQSASSSALKPVSASMSTPKPSGLASPLSNVTPKSFTTSLSTYKHDASATKVGPASTSAFASPKTCSQDFRMDSKPGEISSSSADTPEISILARDFETLVGQLTKNQGYTSDDKVAIDQALPNYVEEIVDAIREIFSVFGDFEKSYEECKDRCAEILARRADILKNLDESQKLKTWQTSKESQSVLSQPLDAKSEEMQRSVGSLALSLHRQMEIIRDRLTLQENMATANGGASLAAESLESYNRIKMFDSVTERYERRVDELFALLKARSTNGSRGTLLTRREGGSNQLSSGNKSRDASLQSFISLGPSAFASLATPPVSSFSFAEVTTGVLVDSGVVPLEKTSSAGRTAAPIFSPLKKTKPRQQWDETSSVDQARTKNLSFTSPHSLKETTVDNAAHGALGKFGTTPEKLRGYNQAQRNTPQHIGMSKSPSAASLSFSGRERRTQPEINSLSSSSSTPPPPSASATVGEGKAPGTTMNSERKSASQAKSPRAPSGESPSSGTSFTGSFTAKPGDKVAASSLASSSIGGASSGGAEDNTTTATFELGRGGGLGGMSLLGNASLFDPDSSSGKVDSKKVDSTEATGESKSPDYHKILTQFYEEHEPNHVHRVGELLEKYKVSTVASLLWLTTLFDNTHIFIFI